MGDADAEKLRVDDGRDPGSGGHGHTGRGRHAHLRHAVQTEVRPAYHHAGEYVSLTVLTEGQLDELCVCVCVCVCLCICVCERVRV